MNIIKFDELPIHDLGNNIEICGMVIQGQGKTYNVMFSRAELQEPILVQVDHEEWKKFLHQLDTLETILFPGAFDSKVVVRKSQRNIEQGISWNVFRRDNYVCRYCGANDVPLTVDHIILWEDMGPTVEENLITSCRKCNKMRGNMKFEDWLKSDYYKKGNAQIEGKYSQSYEIDKLNKEAFQIAKILPLRVSLRGR